MDQNPDNAREMDQAIDEFITKLFDAKGLDMLVGTTRDDALAELKGMFLNYLNVSILNALPDEKMAEVAAIDTNLTPDEVRAKIDDIVESANLDIESITTKTAQDFSDSYLKGDESVEAPETPEVPTTAETPTTPETQPEATPPEAPTEPVSPPPVSPEPATPSPEAQTEPISSTPPVTTEGVA